MNFQASELMTVDRRDLKKSKCLCRFRLTHDSTASDI